jgi:hypothetical protein
MTASLAVPSYPIFYHCGSKIPLANHYSYWLAFPLLAWNFSHGRGDMDRKRILELAADALNKQKAEIDAELVTIQAELKRVGIRAAEKPAAAAAPGRKPRTPAQRKAQSQSMKEYWAAKRLKTAKPSLPAKTAPAGAKGRPKTAAQKRALSLKMKQVWAKRKAAAKKF